MSELPHLFIEGFANDIDYTANRARNETNLPIRDRALHSSVLLEKLNSIWAEQENFNEQRSAALLPVRDGVYLEFRSQLGYDLITKSLEDVRQGVRLLNVREIQSDNQKQTIATVYIPRGKEAHFIRKITDYRDRDSARGNPLNQPLVTSIDDIKFALIESLWTDPTELIPFDDSKWCEIWLRTGDNSLVIEGFISMLTQLNIEFKSSYLEFPERSVILIRANRHILNELITISSFLAEIRIGQEAASFWVNEPNIDQALWANDLVERLNLHLSDVSVCILDTGINNAHPLLVPHVEVNECLTVEPIWGVNDHYSNAGHGTLMSGLAIYGNVEKALLSNEPIEVTHRLCSVKILPPPNQAHTPVELWGLKTEQAVSLTEINSPDRRIIYCMAVTSPVNIDRGRPSSWSGSIDKLAYGEGETQRLIIISGGNIRDEIDWLAYPDSNLTKSIENPAQAWNSLTVGAVTNLINVSDLENYPGATLVASRNCLSPYSTTSLAWGSKWPSKPDIVFEGGNLLKDIDDSFIDHQDLSPLSTSKQFDLNSHFDTINATSSATAQASWMAAKLMYQYPDAWPETIRGLMVHSARWAPELISQFRLDVNRKADAKKILRICGYGKPNLKSALFSSENSLTLIAQEYIQPFSTAGSMNQMHFYELPWPTEELAALGDIQITIRITLSYFIEPGPGEIGWKDKYRYQSFGLRFDLSTPTDTSETFNTRVNAAMRDEDDRERTDAGADRWLIGKNGRSLGSIHSDTWTDSASQIAACNMVAIYPVVGWWRERKNLRKTDAQARYSLIVSIETPITETDIYSPVAIKIQTPVEIVVPTS